MLNAAFLPETDAPLGSIGGYFFFFLLNSEVANNPTVAGLECLL